MMTRLFTTAPELYDLPGTVPIGHVGFTATGGIIRAVAVDLGGAVVQAERYLIAGYETFDRAQLEAAIRAGGHMDHDALAELDDEVCETCGVGVFQDLDL